MNRIIGALALAAALNSLHVAGSAQSALGAQAAEPPDPGVFVQPDDEENASTVENGTFDVSAGPEWVAVMPGKFMMGAEPGPDVLKPGAPRRYEVEKAGRVANIQADVYQGPHWDERPVHEVTISNAFEISRRVTLGEFLRYKPEHAGVYASFGMDANPAAPVTMVTWHEAQGYGQWLSQAEGSIYRLPTEAEWEYAAGQASALGLGGLGDGLMEWCHDWWAPYADQAVTDPLGPADGEVKILRGRLDKLGRARITDRSGGLPEERRRDISFRVARVADIQGTHRPSPPLDPVFREVSQKQKTWEPVDAGTPVFEGGRIHIDKQAGNFDAVHLPYWGRHHVPSIVYCDNGDILVAVFTAPNDASDQMAILMARLRHGADHWDPPARFFLLPDRKIDAAVLHRDDEGVLYHFNAIGGEEDDSKMAARRVSRDNGATWSRPEIVSFHLSEHYSHFPGRVVGVQGDLVTLDDGAFLMPKDVIGGPLRRGTALFKSTDRGLNWHEMTRLGWNAENYGKKEGEAGWIAGWHAPFAILRDGSFLAIGREVNMDGRAALSRSRDHGRTWSYEPSEFSPLTFAQRTQIKRLAEGPLMIIWPTDPSAKRGSEEGIAVVDAAGQTRRITGTYAALSFDEGVSWSHHKLLPLSADDPYKSDLTGYYSAVQSPDGMIHVANSSSYWRFNLAWLKEPMPAAGPQP